MELGWLYIPFPSLSTTALLLIFHRIYLPRIYLPNEFFFSPTEMKSSFCDGDLHSLGRALLFQKYLNISYPFGVFSLQKDCQDQGFPPAFTPSNPTVHFLAGNQIPDEWGVVLLASCCFLEIFPAACSSDEWRSNFEFHSRFIQGNNFLCVSHDKQMVKW